MIQYSHECNFSPFRVRRIGRSDDESDWEVIALLLLKEMYLSAMSHGRSVDKIILSLKETNLSEIRKFRFNYFMKQ